MTQTTNTQTQKTLEEKLADIMAKHGKDYIITWDNHPDIMQEVTQQFFDELEADSVEVRKTEENRRDLETNRGKPRFWLSHLMTKAPSNPLRPPGQYRR